MVHATVITIIVGTIFGLFTELLQYIFHISRNASIYDAIADTTGVVLGVTVQWIRTKKRATN